MTWPWDSFVGSREALALNRRDLPTLVSVIKQTPRHRVVVQAGGNLGIFPKRLAQDFTTVYTCEPDPENFAALCANAPERNIVKLQVALGFHRAPVSIGTNRRDGQPRSAHEGLRYVAGAGTIPQLRIDDLGLPVCDLIYLDVEGGEVFALQGGAQTITRCQPLIAVEINRWITYVGLTAEDVHRQMADLGYRHTETLGSDYVFLPTERAA